MRDNFSAELRSLRSLLPALRRGISSDGLLSFNRILAAAPTANLTLSGKLIGLKLADEQRPDDAPLYCAALCADDRQLNILFSIEMLAALYKGQVLLEHVRPGLIELLVRHALGAHLPTLETLLGKPVSLRVQPLPVAEPDMALVIQAAVEGFGEEQSILLSGDFDFAVSLLRLCTTNEPTARRIIAPVDAEVSTIAVLLDKEDAAALAPGDFLFLSDKTADDIFVLKAGGTVLSAIHNTNGNLTVGQTMNQKIAGTEPRGQAKKDVLVLEHPQISASQVSLTIELGRWKMTLDEVQNIHEGMLLEFGDIDLNKATLRVNGEAVATGSLISVGDGVGLQINSVT